MRVKVVNEWNSEWNQACYQQQSKGEELECVRYKSKWEIRQHGQTIEREKARESKSVRKWEKNRQSKTVGKQDGERPKQLDCEKERIRIPNLFPLLFSSSFYMARPRAHSDEADRQTTVLLMAESQVDVSDTLSKNYSNHWDRTHFESFITN